MKDSLALSKKISELKDLEAYAEGSAYSDNDGYYAAAPLNIRSYWQALIKYLWLIISITAAGTILMLVYVSQKPDYYVAEARVQVNTESNPAVGASKGGSVVFNSQVSDPAYFSTQLQILEGSGLLRRVVKTLDLQHNRAFLQPLAGQERSAWQNVKRVLGFGDRKVTPEVVKGDGLKLDVDTFTKHYDETEEGAEELAPYVSMLRSGMEISPVKEGRVAYKETRLIDIAFTHYDPQVAMKVANAISDIYVLSNLEKKVQSNLASGDFLQKRVAELQRDIRSGEERLLNYSRDHQILSLDEKQNIVVQRLAELNSQLMQAENERNIAEAAYKASQAPGAATSLTEGTDSQTTMLEGKLLELKQQRDLLLGEYKEDAPEITEVTRQIRSMQQSIEERRNHSTSTLSTILATKFHQAEARESELRRLFDQQRAEVLGQNEAAINYRIIQQEIETNKSLLEGLLQSSKENDVVLSDTPNNVLVVDHALMPKGAAGPRRSGSIVIAFFMSLGLGVGLSLLLKFMDDAVRTVEDVENAIKLPVIGAIPSLSGGMGIVRFIPLVGKLRKKNRDHGVGLITRHNDPSIQTESYLHMRTSLLLSNAGGPPRRLLITSSQPTEGKTTTAINLATVLAQTGAKVLLIDADLRRPRVHLALDMSNQRGLTTLLAGSNLEKSDVLSTIVKCEEAGFFALTSGPTSPNPANLLGSQQMRTLLSTLDSAFDHIIIDSPPAVFFTDSVILSSLVEGVLLVVRSGESTRGLIQRGTKMFRDVGANVIGVVLNDMASSAQEYTHQSYGYRYENHAQASASDNTLGLT